MQVRLPRPDDLDHYAVMRHALWPHLSVEEHKAELESGASDAAATFIALSPEGRPVGFVEATIRTDYVNGCSTSPVVFVEGLYVAPDFRRRGLARELVRQVENWGQEAGCRELASDTELENHGSRAAHLAMGFEETEKVVYFRKLLVGAP